MRKAKLRQSEIATALTGNEGLTLVEVMVASIILAIGIVGLVGAIGSSMIVDTVAQENNLALDTARELLEQIKSEPFSDLVYDRVEATAPPPETDGGYYYETTQPPWYTLQTSDTPAVTNVTVDANGNFNVPGLAPLSTDVDRRVGKIEVTKVEGDIVEIVVTMRWDGKRGPTERVLRCQVADWGY